jgi:putative membrane protein
MTKLASDKSLNQSMNSALKHYSSLFFLPPFKKALGWIAVLCIGVVGFSTFWLFRSFDWLALSLLLGVALFAINLFFDYVLSNAVLRRDPVFTIRRTVGLTLFCWVLWLPFIVLGVFFGAVFGLWLWIRFCLLGFCVVLTLRAVVFFSVSSAGQARAAVASLLQPCGCIVAFMLFWAGVDNAILIQLLPFVVVTPFLCLASALLFVSLIDRQGRQMYGVPSMSLFKAFMLNWVVGLNEPIESFLEKLGEDADVEVSFLKFDSSKPKAAIVVPLVHPGPFKNIGSSLLPFLLKRDFERAFHCHACVPLGILGHELDLASQPQNQKIIDSVITSATLEASIDVATPFVRITDGSATASCQVFGNAVFLSFTLAPKTTEDLPQELGNVVREEAEKRGLDCSLIVNAHNSITESAEMDESLESLRYLAAKCLDKAVASSSAHFEVGAATVYPKEFTLKDGMGAGGITAILVKVAEQKTAYVVIDGNNMISGLREEILSALAASGFDESEVFTTDTHAVSAVILGRRGYHPIGEAMNHETLIGHIKEAALTASAGLESCRAACQRLVVPKVRVIGADRIHSLTTLVDMALQRAKQIIVPIFAVEGILLILFLAVL